MHEPEIRGLLLDIDGVLTTSWQALPGSVDAMSRVRASRVPFRLITNTTTLTRADLARTLGEAGFEVAPDEIVTAVVATSAHLISHHPGTNVFVLSDGDATRDLADVSLVDRVEDADVVVIGGACDGFSYDVMNRIFGRLMDGAALVGMHRNLYWRTAAGWELDGGAYIAGLEEAVGVRAAICGKPAHPFFEAVLSMLDIPAAEALMVGDDMVNDVLGAQALGIRGALVRTGKFQPGDLHKGEPHFVLDGLADVPALLGA